MNERTIWGIVGSRTFTDYSLLCAVLDDFLRPGDAVVSGGAKGADALARRYVLQCDYEYLEHLPRFDAFKNSTQALFVRNGLIVNDADELIVFFGPDGPSKGASHTMKLAFKKRIPVHVYFEDVTND